MPRLLASLPANVPSFSRRFRPGVSTEVDHPEPPVRLIYPVPYRGLAWR